MKHLVRRRLLAFQSSAVFKGTHVQLAADGVDFPQLPEGETDGTEENVFSLLNVVLVLTSTLSYTIDIFSCSAVCYLLYYENHSWWFIFTVLSLIISLVVVNCFSMRWYLHDMHEEKFMVGGVSPTHWGLRIFFHVILLGPVIRYMELLCYGIHSMDQTDPKRRAYKVLVVQEDRDTSLLALVGSFIKSAPQLVLELYILLQKKEPVGLTTMRAQLVSVVASIVTLSLAMTSYHRALRRSLPSKLNMTKTGSTLQFISHCCIIGCRALTLASFASIYGHWLVTFGSIHWVIMSCWLWYQKTSFCATSSGEPRPCDEFIFNTVMAAVYIFCFLNVKDERTRWKYVFYYAIVWAENIALATLWFLKTEPDEWYRLPLLIGVFSAFATGLIVLGLYYGFFHPNKVSKVTTFVHVVNNGMSKAI